MKLLEYIFFFVFKKYQQWGESSIPGVYALCFISILQILNVFTILLIGLSVNVIESQGNKSYFFVAIYFCFLFFNYYYVYKIKGVNLILNDYTKNEKSNTQLRIISFSYVILTVMLFLICLIIYIKK